MKYVVIVIALVLVVFLVYQFAPTKRNKDKAAKKAADLAAKKATDDAAAAVAAGNSHGNNTNSTHITNAATYSSDLTDAQILNLPPAVFPIRNGSKGREVAHLQQYLNCLGAGGLKVDGSAGPKTMSAFAKISGTSNLAGSLTLNLFDSVTLAQYSDLYTSCLKKPLGNSVTPPPDNSYYNPLSFWSL